MRDFIIVVALVIASVGQAHAQSDSLAAAKAAVQACVKDVRDQAKRPENFQFGAPPMWKDFDAYIAPDGRVFNNVRLVGEQDGLYRFNKCLAEHGFSIGAPLAATSPGTTNQPSTCTDNEIVQRPGDCWSKLSPWEKHLFVLALVDGWVHSFDLAEKQEYEWAGTRIVKFFPSFDENLQTAYYNELYTGPNNRTVSFVDAYDLVLRKTTNPETKDLSALLSMYREHHKPVVDGYLRGFVPPNKVVVSEFRDTASVTVNNETNTVTLLGVSSDASNPNLESFMKALLNLKNCNTLIKLTEAYKYYEYLKTAQARDQEKKMEESAFYPQLKVLIYYPVQHNYQQEEFFNEKSELSGVVLLDRHQTVCDEKREGELLNWVDLGQLMLSSAKDQKEYSALWLAQRGDEFINLNQYLTTNGLQKKVDSSQNDPRPGVKWLFGWIDAAPTKEGIDKVLTVGAPDRQRDPTAPSPASPAR